jgi:hypothetical protein
MHRFLLFHNTISIIFVISVNCELHVDIHNGRLNSWRFVSIQFFLSNVTISEYVLKNFFKCPSLNRDKRAFYFIGHEITPDLLSKKHCKFVGSGPVQQTRIRSEFFLKIKLQEGAATYWFRNLCIGELICLTHQN